MERPTSLHIKNFKCFEDLNLEMVGAVNLIAGKNNVGKTTLLEAVALWASGGNPKELFRMLDRRERQELTSDEDLAKAFLSHFDRPASITTEPTGLLGWSIQSPARIPGQGRGRGTFLSLRRDSHSTLTPSFQIGSGPYDFAFDLTLETRASAYGGVFDRDSSVSRSVRRLRSNISFGDDPMMLKKLWDETVGLEGEDDLVRALKVIEPKVERIVVPSMPGRPTPRLRFQGASELLPISRLGDGMTRLFEIGLAIVNSKDGFLLLDEVENGLHHSVFPRLWEFLFQMARKLSVTVFATTHSHDAVAAFSEVAIEDSESLGVLTRLDKEQGGIVAVQYTEKQAAMSIESGWEVR